MSILQELADAIGSAEGYGVSGAIPTRANNPGDLKLGDIGYGTIGQGITVFPNAAAGNQALINQLQKIQNNTSRYYNSDMSIAQIGQTWSGGDPAWSNNVSKSVGVSPDTSFGSLFSDSFSKLMQNGSAILGATTLGGGLFSFMTKQTTDKEGNKTSAFSFDLGRVVSVILGLILIGAGVMAFRQTSVVIAQGAKIAAKGAELAA